MSTQKPCLMSILISGALSIGYILLIDFIVTKVYDLYIETNHIAYSLVFVSIAMVLTCVFEGIAFVNGVRYILKDVDA